MRTSLKSQIKAVQSKRVKWPIAKYAKKLDRELHDAASTIAAWGFLRASMVARIREIKKQPELKRACYPALVDINAPLALIQVRLEAELRTLEGLAGVTKRVKLPQP